MYAFAATVVLASALGAQPETQIDSILQTTWQSRGIKPAAICSDDEFLRRVSLDLVGRIPTVQELRAFRQRPDRTAKIDELLAGDEFPVFWSEVWATMLHGYRSEFGSDREVLRLWLEKCFREEVSYAKMVEQMVSATGTSAFDGPINFLVRYPEEPAVKVSRLFLGVRLDCARCHDHPFDRWTQTDFEQMSRFFAATDRREVTEGNVRLIDERIEAEVDERPRFLTGAQPRTTRWRTELALFVTHSKPFGRTFVNRLWYQLMGRGIVHPPDDFHRDNPPAIPELLEHLRREAVKQDYAFRPLIRQICASKAYQLSSRRPQRDAVAAQLFAYRTVKPLTIEQTIDSVTIALDLEFTASERERVKRRVVGTALDEDFSETWLYRETVQGLMTRLSENTPAKMRSVHSAFEKILSRRPTDRELELCRRQQPEDIVFALVNSNEFFFNH